MTSPGRARALELRRPAPAVEDPASPPAPADVTALTPYAEIPGTTEEPFCTTGGARRGPAYLVEGR